MNVSVIGISHHTASVAVRESFALPGDAAGAFLQAIRADGKLTEALVLDTCNRTEIYFVWPREFDFAGYLLDLIAKINGVEAITELDGLYRHDGQAAVEHLFAVAAGLDSQIVGEAQILGQLKTAYRLAVGGRAAKFLLRRLMHQTFRVGKRVRTETQLGQGAGSVAQASVALASQIFDTLAGKSVMLVGAGQTAELAARALLRNGAAAITVANRTLCRAQDVAMALAKGRTEQEAAAANDTVETDARTAVPPKVEARAIKLDEIPAAIGEVDLVICSTGSTEPVLTAGGLAGPLRNAGRPVCIIDIAVPRDVDDAVGELPDVYLYNLDDLDRLVAQNLQQRRREIPRAEAIVAEQVRQFSHWIESRQVAPTIQLLRRRLDDLRHAEIKRYGKKFAASDAGQLERFTESLSKKILHKPIAFLHGLAKSGDTPEAMAAVDTLRRMFDLDQFDVE